MKDYFGRELFVGDRVIFALPKNQEIASANILKFGKVKVILDVKNGYSSKPVPINSDDAPSWSKSICRYPKDVAKV